MNGKQAKRLRRATSELSRAQQQNIKDTYSNLPSDKRSYFLEAIEAAKAQASIDLETLGK